MRDELVAIPQDEYDELIKQYNEAYELITFLKKYSGFNANYPIIITIEDDFICCELIRRINKICSAFKIEHDYIEP